MSIDVVINIYIRDNQPLILKRIAAKVNTLPKYIKIISPEKIDFRPKTNVKFTVIDLIHQIKSSKNFNEFYSVVKGQFENLSLIKDIIKPYVYFKVKPIEGLESQIDLLILNIVSQVNKTLPDIEINFDNYIFDREMFLSQLERDIEINKTQIDEYIKNLEKQKDIVGKPKTAFELEKIKFDVITDLRDVTIYEVFDSLILNSKFPLAYVNDYYKIFKDFVIPDETWIQLKLDNIIIVKVVIQNSEPFNVYLFIEENTLRFSFDIKTAQNIDIKKFAIEVVRLLSGKINIIEEKEASINGVYYVPHQTLNKYVFAHLVLNDVRFSQLLYIDESARATKTKEGISVIYNNGIDEVTFVLTDKVVDLYDPDIRDKPRDVFPENDDYLRVKISRAKNIETVVEFGETFSKLLTTYNDSYDDIVKFYRKFIPDFASKKKEKEKPKEGKKKRFLKDIVPDMFTANYRRSCGHPPRIVEKEEADTLEDVMLYPKTPEEGKQHYYTCDDPKYKYIGLTDNKDPAITKYNFVPCCYPRDQKITGAFTKYNEYYHNIGLDKGAGRQQKFIKTNKILSYEIYGSLEPFQDVNMLFDGINDDENYHYIRFGVDRSKFSFVQCVFEAVGKKYKDENERLREIKEEIEKILSDDSLLASGRQEFPDKSVEIIRNILKDENTYFDPKLLIHILEIYYKCKIYIFSSSGLEIPNHFKNYIINENNNPVVIILEHMGSASDKAAYPQCEIIIKANKFIGDDLTYNFSNNSIEANTLKSIFSNMINSYYLSEKVKECKIEKELLEKSKSQIINSFGKTSVLILNENFSIYLKEPIQPLYLSETTDNKFELPELQDILKFIKEPFIINIEKIIDNNGFITTISITTKLNNVYYIPIKNIKDDKRFSFNINDNVNINIPYYKISSGLEIYNQNKKLARYLLETFLYRFSKFVEENNLDINDKSIINFVSQKVTINENIKYGIIPKKFDVDNEGLIRNGKIVLTNNEVLKRLVYCLRLENTQKIKEYFRKKNIENYIQDLGDFRIVKSQLILFGKKAINSYIEDKLKNFIMSNKLLLKEEKPFFFKNYLLGENNVYIAFDFKTDFEGAKEFIFKKQQHFSLGVFNYINSEIINYINGERNTSCVLILKENEDIRYFALLKL